MEKFWEKEERKENFKRYKIESIRLREIHEKSKLEFHQELKNFQARWKDLDTSKFEKYICSTCKNISIGTVCPEHHYHAGGLHSSGCKSAHQSTEKINIEAALWAIELNEIRLKADKLGIYL